MVRRVKATRTMKTIMAVLAVVALGACDDMTAGGGIPNVAGTYTGPVLLRFTDAGIETSGSARLTVVQSGSEITVGGSLTLANVTSEIAAFQGEVSKNRLCHGDGKRGERHRV